MLNEMKHLLHLLAALHVSDFAQRSVCRRRSLAIARDDKRYFMINIGLSAIRYIQIFNVTATLR